MHSYSNGNGAAILPAIDTQVITGRGLAHRELDARQRAALVADVLEGAAVFVPSQAQLAAIFNVSIPYIAVARRLTPGERAAIVRGWNPVSFTKLMNPPRQLSLAGPVIPTMKISDTTEITDIALEGLARIVGPDRMLNAAAAAELA
jgi:hypothetical protein